MSWFDVDRKGLAKLIEKKGKAFILFELIQNAWDAPGCTHVEVSLVPIEGRALAQLIVKDNSPDGFHDLAHAYTLFAESVKKGDALKRGRFNFGEKLVLALCEDASVQSTKGTVRFLPDGTRENSRAKTTAGSVFMGKVRVTRAELLEVETEVRKLLPPAGIETTFNGKKLQPRPVAARGVYSLPTVGVDEDGRLVRTTRNATLQVIEPEEGEVGTIYEMGIPIVETGDHYHVNVGQKVPLTLERDNVPPSYLKQVRAAVLSLMSDQLTTETASEAWVTDALTSQHLDSDVIRAAVTARFGEHAAIYDPSDVEASHNLTALGHTIVHGGSLPAAAWENVRQAGALLPAGKIAPTPKPYSNDPNAPPVKVLAPEEETAAMRALRALVESIVMHGRSRPGLFAHRVTVRFVDSRNNFGAAYGSATLDFNVRRLGRSWFHERPLYTVLDLLVHELAHEHAMNHLDASFHEACTRLGAEVADQAFDKNRQAFLDFLDARAR